MQRTCKPIVTAGQHEHPARQRGFDPLMSGGDACSSRWLAPPVEARLTERSSADLGGSSAIVALVASAATTGRTAAARTAGDRRARFRPTLPEPARAHPPPSTPCVSPSL